MVQGTAATEAEEFFNVYNLNVVEVPSRLPNQRIDQRIRMFADREAKLVSLYLTVLDAHNLDRPVLIGTSSVADSEEIEKVLAGEYGFSRSRMYEDGVFGPFWWGCNLLGMKAGWTASKHDIK